MKNSRTRDLTMSAIFLAAALTLPFLTAQIPEIGSMLLPMHIPVLLCGLICGYKWGFLIGLLAPLTRSLLFGVPVLYPNAVAMAFEIATYGAVIGLVFSLFKKKNIVATYVSLVCAMLAGRAVWGTAMAILLGLSKFTFSAFLASAFINAIPGIILQLVLIPSIMVILRRAKILSEKRKRQQDCLNFTADDLKIPPDLLACIREMSVDCDKFIIAIDGRCGSGKSTLASALGTKLSASVFHIDDFFLPRSMRTEERLAEPGGNFDRERFLSEVLKPVSNMKNVRYRRYDCKTDEIRKAQKIPFTKFIIIEGAYALHPELTPYYDLKVFYDIDKELQAERITARCGEDGATDFFNKWIPLEETYIEEVKIIDTCDKIINAKP